MVQARRKKERKNKVYPVILGMWRIAPPYCDVSTELKCNLIFIFAIACPESGEDYIT